MIVVSCPQPADTANLGARLAPMLKAGDIVVLVGELGSGKTLFTSGLAAGLGVDEGVTSPSFVLVRKYRTGFLPLTHADIYRLRTRNEFEDLDLITDAENGVLVIEWGDAIEAALPDDHLRVDFQVGESEERDITFTPGGSWRSRLPGGLLM